jgi:hypothetical protein
MKLKLPSQIDYTNVPSVKVATKYLAAALVRKFYVRPKKTLKAALISTYVDHYRLPIDEPISNTNGIKGLFLVASYTDKDSEYLPGMLEASSAFDQIILYRDNNIAHNFKYNESIRFQSLISAAKRRGATWVLIGSPKTRFSKEFRDQIEPYIKKYNKKPVVLGIKERYLWEKFDQYAYPKNVIGDAIIYKLFSITNTMTFDNLPIHASQYPINYVEKVVTEASRYYLGRFNLNTMRQKAEFYHNKDGKDYTYLYDMAKPEKHHEHILGIGKFETEQLITK